MLMQGMTEASRKLASIRLISDISPIDGADNIEKAIIDGWTCVVKKGEFKPGDLCVYFEIDSFLPIRPEFEFLRKSCYKKLADGREGFRLKTIKLRGVVSQGLVLPVTILDNFKEKFCDLSESTLERAMLDLSKYIPDPTSEITLIYGIELRYKSMVRKDYPVETTLNSGLRIWQGMDVTTELGVTKYEPPIPVEMQGKISNFPSFLRKTDQERVQNIWNQVKDLDDTFEVTVKLDGMSCTYYYYNGKFGVCSRNCEIEENEDNTLWKIAKRHNIKGMLESYSMQFRKHIALQGEVIGEGIQGNREGLIGQKFCLFDIFDIDKQTYLSPTHRTLINKFLFNGPHVPIIDTEAHLSFFKSLKEILSYADGPSLNNPIREGVVFKSKQNPDVRFKVISNEFLLKEKG
jgi:RNA ligase (TIGR02306 family)